jgi:hypothetical protein
MLRGGLREVLSPKALANVHPTSPKSATSPGSSKASSSRADRENVPLEERLQAFAAMTEPLPVKNTFIEFRPSRPSWRRADSMPDPLLMDSKRAEPRTADPDLHSAVLVLSSSGLSEEDFGVAGDSRRSSKSKEAGGTEGGLSLESFAEMKTTLESVVVSEEEIPRDEWGNLTSIGSIKHACKECKPCVFHYHAGRVCANGINCEFCHFWHPRKHRTRASKRKRMARKELELNAASSQAAQDADDFSEADTDGVQPPEYGEA